MLGYSAVMPPWRGYSAFFCCGGGVHYLSCCGGGGTVFACDGGITYSILIFFLLRWRGYSTFFAAVEGAHYLFVTVEGVQGLFSYGGGGAVPFIVRFLISGPL